MIGVRGIGPPLLTQKWQHGNKSIWNCLIKLPLLILNYRDISLHSILKLSLEKWKKVQIQAIADEEFDKMTLKETDEMKDKEAATKGELKDELYRKNKARDGRSILV